MAIGVLSINVHGIPNSAKKQILIFWISQQPHEVRFLQESFLYKEDDVQEFKQLWNGKAYFSFGRFNSRVGILFKTLSKTQLKLYSMTTMEVGQCYYVIKRI